MAPLRRGFQETLLGPPGINFIPFLVALQFKIGPLRVDFGLSRFNFGPLRVDSGYWGFDFGALEVIFKRYFSTFSPKECTDVYCVYEVDEPRKLNVPISALQALFSC